MGLEDWKSFVETLQREGVVVRDAPIAFLTCTAVVVLVLWWIFEWHYGGALGDKDAANERLTATIQNKDATIQLKDTQISTLQGTVDFLNKRVAALGNVPLSPSSTKPAGTTKTETGSTAGWHTADISPRLRTPTIATFNLVLTMSGASAGGRGDRLKSRSSR